MSSERGVEHSCISFELHSGALKTWAFANAHCLFYSNPLSFVLCFVKMHLQHEWLYCCSDCCCCTVRWIFAACAAVCKMLVELNAKIVTAYRWYEYDGEHTAATTIHTHTWAWTRTHMTGGANIIQAHMHASNAHNAHKSIDAERNYTDELTEQQHCKTKQ